MARIGLSLVFLALISACASMGAATAEATLRAAGWPRVEPRPTDAADWPVGQFPKSRFEYRSIEPGETMGGGPPRDGIPALTNPAFTDPESAAKWLGAKEPVGVLAIGGEVKAYPYRILTYHEIVNDTVGGVPVAVTWCPLCNSGLAFDRRLDGVELEFGVSGRLRLSNMVIYDRQTESWFQQIDGEGFAGILTGARLERVGMTVVAFEDASSTWPALQVLDQDRTGHSRPYGRNPYTRYDAAENYPFMLGAGLLPAGSGLAPMARVVVLEEPRGEELPVVPLAAVTERGVVRVGEFIVAAAGTHSSPLDREEIGAGREIAQATVWFAPQEGEWTANGGVLTAPDGGGFDSLSGASLGAAAPLEPARHSVHFWFAWAVFDIDAEIWSP